jgi:serine phosphatase RsbU (regulator of sigma subunit)
MSTNQELIDQLHTLNQIAETLNRAVDVDTALETALARLVGLMGLETGWIFTRDEAAQEKWAGRGYRLAAHYNLPPALAVDSLTAWNGGCDCQALCKRGELNAAYNEVRCSRLAEAAGNRRGLAVHASAPLHAGQEILGILNVAGPEWAAFTERSLALLTNVGSQMGIALERARLFNMVQDQRIHEQAALLNLSNRLLRRPDLQEMICCLVDEVKELLQADACAVLLPDETGENLVFEAAVGWQSDPVGEKRRVPIDETSGSGWVMLNQKPLLITSDMAGERSFWRNEWLQAEGFRSAAIAPLLAERRSIGVLVIDYRQPRELDAEELRLLQLLANQAAIAIEKARLHQEELARHRLERDLAVGKEIQLSLLPKNPPQIAGWEFAAVYQAAHMVGGDFYDFIELPAQPGQGRRLGVVIADVSDKGVPAALFMAASRTIIRSAARGGAGVRQPAAALIRANELIFNDSQTDMFLSAFYGILDSESGEFTFCNAGHNHPVWFEPATGQMTNLDSDGIVLGVLDKISLEDKAIYLVPGDFIIFYTDGVTEAMDGRLTEFGLDKLREIIGQHAHSGAEQLLWAIVDAVNAFTADAPQSDDFTLVVLKRL